MNYCLIPLLALFFSATAASADDACEKEMLALLPTQPAPRAASVRDSFRASVRRRIRQTYPDLSARLSELPNISPILLPDQIPDVEEAPWLLANPAFRLRRFIGDHSMEETPIYDVRSPHYVTVYRVVRDVEPGSLDLGANYRRTTRRESGAFGQDFVAASIQYTFDYVQSNDALLIRYDLPAVFLRYDDNRRQEASYFISPAVLRRYGIRSPAVFVSRVARISGDHFVAYGNEAAERYERVLREGENMSEFEWLTPGEVSELVRRSY